VTVTFIHEDGTEVSHAVDVEISGGRSRLLIELDSGAQQVRVEDGLGNVGTWGPG
jgi:hypothetical protein